MDKLTPRQRQVLDFLAVVGKAHSRRVAGEFDDLRSQDAGRILEALHRKGLVIPDYEGGTFGYRLVD